MHFNFSSCCCEELWKKDMITNSRGLPSSFIYVVLVVVQDPGRTEPHVMRIDVKKTMKPSFACLFVL
jgi:hypothetical protein